MSVTPPPGYGLYARYYKPVGGTKIAANVLGFQNTSGSVASAVIGAIRTACSAGIAAYATGLLSDTWEWVGDYALVNVGGTLTSDVNTVVIPGTATFACPAPNLSVVVSKKTNLAGRQYHGRIAFPAGFIDETEVNDAGVIDTGVVTSLQLAFNALMSNATTAGVPLVLLHDTPKVGTAPAPTPVTFLTVQGLCGTQRKRLR